MVDLGSAIRPDRDPESEIRPGEEPGYVGYSDAVDIVGIGGRNCKSPRSPHPLQRVLIAVIGRNPSQRSRRPDVLPQISRGTKWLPITPPLVINAFIVPPPEVRLQCPRDARTSSAVISASTARV